MEDMKNANIVLCILYDQARSLQIADKMQWNYCSKLSFDLIWFTSNLHKHIHEYEFKLNCLKNSFVNRNETI